MAVGPVGPVGPRVGTRRIVERSERSDGSNDLAGVRLLARWCSRRCSLRMPHRFRSLQRGANLADQRSARYPSIPGQTDTGRFGLFLPRTWPAWTRGIDETNPAGTPARGVPSRARDPGQILGSVPACGCRPDVRAAVGRAGCGLRVPAGCAGCGVRPDVRAAVGGGTADRPAGCGLRHCLDHRASGSARCDHVKSTG